MHVTENPNEEIEAAVDAAGMDTIMQANPLAKANRSLGNRSENREAFRPAFFPGARMAVPNARAATRKSAQIPVRNNGPRADQPVQLSEEEILNHYLTENFEAYLWMKERPGGTLRNLTKSDKNIKPVWNDIWGRIPLDLRANYDTYYRELVAHLNWAVTGDATVETKQRILAQVEIANDYVCRLPLPEGFTHSQPEPQAVQSTPPPQMAATMAPPVASAVTSAVVPHERKPPPVTQPVVETAMARKPEEKARITVTEVTAVASPVLRTEEKNPPVSKPKFRGSVPSKSEEKDLNNHKMKKFEEFLWGSGDLVGTLQSLAMADPKIKPVWDEAEKQIPPDLKERYATYHAMLLCGLSRSAWWDCFGGTKKTKQKILAQVKEADAIVEGLTLPEGSAAGRTNP